MDAIHTKNGYLSGFRRKEEKAGFSLWKKPRKRGFSLASQAAQLRQARTAQDARMVMSKLHSTLGQLRSAQGGGDEISKQALLQMEKLLRVAARKVKSLVKEEARQADIRETARKGRQEQAEELRRELILERQKRKARENAELSEFARGEVGVERRDERKNKQDFETKSNRAEGIDISETPMDEAAFSEPSEISISDAPTVDISV